jgi:hypothetical protein
VANWDYDIQVNLTQAELFEIANYRQVSGSNNEYTVVLNVNNDSTNTQLDTTGIAPNTGRRFLGFETSDTAGARLVEILAMKLFGHAKARAAIENDTEVAANQTLIAQGLFNSFTTDRNDIFGQYVNLDLVERDANNTNGYNDVDGTRNFNFSGVAFEVPLRVLGAVDAASADIVKNGPTDVGGALVESGSYNVPLKITLNIA